MYAKDLKKGKYGPFYHGTKANLKVGDLLTAGRKSNYHPDVIMNHIYFTLQVNGAGLAAELAPGDAEPRVYMVEVTGDFEDDPTQSYRSKAALKVLAEVSDWPRLSPEELQRWRENLAKIHRDPNAIIIN